jgi:uncharacterized phage protein (TIGR01671 family)
MREIKFRAWIKKAKQMATWQQILKECDRFSLLQNEDFVFMQFTGLKDKKRTEEFPDGQPIYEGDIIKLTEEAQWGKMGRELPTENFAVEWVADEVSFQFDHTSHLPNLGGHNIPLLLSIGQGEVIGNIHQNPELLKKDT